ncbi:MAG: hypothetical protein MAG453_02047 [Calditrichaeota bacterium]|nr:hypothetical protein [Calditrichota bacterium]
MRVLHFILPLFLLSAALSADLRAAAADELGLPFVTSYLPRDYRGMSQNWDVDQDARGFIYVANGYGVIEFDGSEWRWVDREVQRTARSIAAGPSERLYAGYHDEFGWFDLRAGKELPYTSLSEQLPDSLRGFGDVWSTLVHDGHVYFCGYYHLFRWRIGEDGPVADAFRAWNVSREHTLQGLSVVGGRLLLVEVGNGLLELRDGALHLLPGTSELDLTPVWSLLEYPGDRILLVGYDGMYLYDGESITPFDTPASDAARRLDGYNASKIGGDLYALGTDNDGLVLFDSDGRVLRTANRDFGLPDNRVFNRPFRFDGEVLFPAWRTLYRRNDVNDSLVAAETNPLHSFAVDSSSINLPVTAADGSVWFQDDAGACRRAYLDGDGELQVTAPLGRINTYGYGVFYADGDALWAATHAPMLVRYQPPDEPAPPVEFRAHIRRVHIGADSTLPMNVLAAGRLELAHQFNTLRIEYAIPRYDAPDRNQYQVRLVRNDVGWSEWSADSHQQFSNLKSGLYRLEVRARDVHGHVSRPASLEFHIAQPWYATGWALVLWTFLFLAAGFIVVRVRVQAIERQRRRLDALVRKRSRRTGAGSALRSYLTVARLGETTRGFVAVTAQSRVTVALAPADRRARRSPRSADAGSVSSSPPRGR